MIEQDSSINRPIIIGVSSCLLGEKVRYDGQHKRNSDICDIPGDCFEFLPICPEVGAGMGVPREAVQLRGNPDFPRMIGIKSGEDWTSKVLSFSHARISRHDFSSLSGFIFKKNSPSCGMKKVCLYSDEGVTRRNGIGIFARAVMDKYPLLPVEEEERLSDIQIREKFIERVLAYYQLNN
jgi:uncharacterized protein YbbK (DUF523 family)